MFQFKTRIMEKFNNKFLTINTLFGVTGVFLFIFQLPSLIYQEKVIYLWKKSSLNQIQGITKFYGERINGIS